MEAGISSAVENMAEAPVPSLRVQLYQHQPSHEKNPVPISSYADRYRVQEVFRDALSKADHPSTFVVQAMQEEKIQSTK